MCQFIGKRSENTVAKRVASIPNVAHLDVTVHATITAATTTTKWDSFVLSRLVFDPSYIPYSAILSLVRPSQLDSHVNRTPWPVLFILFLLFFFFFFFLSFFSPSSKKGNPGVKLSFGTLYKTCPSAHFTRLVLQHTLQDLSFGRLFHKTCPSAHFTRLVLRQTISQDLSLPSLTETRAGVLVQSQMDRPLAAGALVKSLVISGGHKSLWKVLRLTTMYK